MDNNLTDKNNNNTNKNNGNPEDTSPKWGFMSFVETVSPPLAVDPSKSLFDGIFKHPIQYLETEKIHHLSSTVSNDLELIDVNTANVVNTQKGETDATKTGVLSQPPPNNSMYNYLFQPTHLFGIQMMKEWESLLRYLCNKNA